MADDIHTDAHDGAAYEWTIACDEHGSIVELGVGILPGRMPPWPMPRPTSCDLHDLADRLVQVADGPRRWMPVDEAP